MSYDYNNSKILQQQEHPSNQTANSQQLEMQARALQEEIQMTIYNYESLLQLQKKNATDRSQFLLFLIQSTRTRQQEEFQALKMQLETTVAERQQAHSLEKQMQSIGEGVDSIVQEGKKLKAQNQSLQRQLQQQQMRQKELDEQISASQKELEGERQKIDEWQRTKIKWNRCRKQMLQMMSDAQKQINSGHMEVMEEEEENEEELINGLFNKYKGTRGN